MLISACGLSFLSPKPFLLTDCSASFYQKLLQSKGFSPKERIYLKSSSKPGWMNATVEVLLQIARIVQLNEVTSCFTLCIL